MTSTEMDMESFEKQFEQTPSVPEYCEIAPPRHARLEEAAVKVYEMLKRCDQVPFGD